MSIVSPAILLALFAVLMNILDNSTVLEDQSGCKVVEPATGRVMANKDCKALTGQSHVSEEESDDIHSIAGIGGRKSLL